MGGKALKNIKTRRFEKNEFEVISSLILNKLRVLFPNTQMQTIEYYRNKPDFGDLDVLVESSHLPHNYIQLIKDHFMTKESLKNGNIFSFEFNELQVDLILTKTEDFNISKVYFSYNDLGNLMGRVADKMGFKYGNRGLLFKADTANQRTTEILISQDPEKIFDFLGFDFSRYLRGFDEVLDIFDYVTNSKYFSKELYLMENRNNKGRTRDKKRNTYMLFLKHIENLTETKHPLQARAVYEAEAEKVFSNFNQQKNILCAAIKNKKELRQKFNGDLVMKLTNKKGPELGNFIREFKSQYTDFDAWVENETQENIESSINDFLLKQLR